MRIKEFMEKYDGYDIYYLVREIADNFDHRTGKFRVCIDELEWFKEKGIKNRLHDCTGKCIECELAFFEQEVEI